MLKIQSSRSLLRFIQSLNCNHQRKTGNQLGKFQTLHHHGWYQSGLYSFFIFVDCNKLLSPGLVPLPVSSFPQHAMALASLTSLSLQGNFNVTASCFNVWDSTWSFGLLLRAGIPSPSLSSVAFYAQVDPLHYSCCSWWSSHGTDISNTQGCYTPTRLQWPLIGSLHGAKP